MAFNPLPQPWFAGLTDDATTLSIPIASIPELTAAEIDATTGDIRKFLYALSEQAWTVWNTLATADKPGKMTIYKSTSTNAATAITTHTYTLTFRNSVSAQDVADED